MSFTFTQITRTQDAPSINNQLQLKEWLTSYAAPCIAGGLVGFTTGKLSASITKTALNFIKSIPILSKDPMTQWMILLTSLTTIIGTLIAENQLRAKCVNSVNQSFEKYGIEHSNLANNTARLISWLEFLNGKNYSK